MDYLSNSTIFPFNFGGIYIGTVMDNSTFNDDLKIKVFIPELFGYDYDISLVPRTDSLKINRSKILNKYALDNTLTVANYLECSPLIQNFRNMSENSFENNYKPVIGDKVLVMFLNDNPLEPFYINMKIGSPEVLKELSEDGGDGSGGNASVIIVGNITERDMIKEVSNGLIVLVQEDETNNNKPTTYIHLNGEWVALAGGTGGGVEANILSYYYEYPKDRTYYCNPDEDNIIKFIYTSTIPGKATYEVRVNNIKRVTETAPKSIGNEPITINIGKLDFGTNIIRIDAYNADNHEVTEGSEPYLIYTFISGGITMNSNFDQTIKNVTFDTSNKIKIPFNGYLADPTDYDKLFAKITLTNINTKEKYENEIQVFANENSGTFSSEFEIESIESLGFQSGNYEVKIQTYVMGINYEGIKYESSPLIFEFPIILEYEIIVSSNYNPSNLTSLSYISMPYTLTTNRDYILQAKRELYKLNDNGIYELLNEKSDIVSANNKIQSNWIIGRLREGNYKIKIIGTTDTLNMSLCPTPFELEFGVAYEASKKRNYITNRNGMPILLAYFNPQEYSNDLSENVRNKWIATDGIKKDDWYFELNNFNFNTNGWIDDIDQGLDEEGNYQKYLKLHGKSYGILKDKNNNLVYLMNSNLSYDNASITTDGFSLECLFKTRCIGDLKTKVLTMFSEDRDSDVLGGLNITYDKMNLNSKERKISLNTTEDEWIHVVFTMDNIILSSNNVNDKNPLENVNPTRTLRIYINGILCKCATMGNDDTFGSPNSVSYYPTILNAIYNSTLDIFENFGSAEIKLIRIYNSPLKSSEVLNNFISSRWSIAEQENIDSLNDDEQSNLAIVRFLRLESSPFTFSHINSITEKAKSKTDYVRCLITIDYKGVGSNKNKEFIGDVYLQGTSSLAYPVKNYKIKTIKDPLTGKKVKMVMDPYEHWLADTAWTLKCDYMEASHRHNSGTANFIHKIYDSLGVYNPAQKYILKEADKDNNGIHTNKYVNLVDGEYRFKAGSLEKHEFDINNNQNPDIFQKFPNIRSTIDGFPCVVYYTDDITGKNWEYAGSFMFNIDKSGSSFGYDPKFYQDTPYLFASEVSSVYHQDFINSPNGKIYKCLSYEGVANKSNTAGAFYKYNGSLNEDGQLSSDEVRYLHEDFEARFDDDDPGALKRMIDWVSDAADDYWNNGGNKFRNEFSDYFDLDFCLIYYNQMMTFGMVDNAGKNAMFTSWDGLHWYPEFYDMDTILGLNNSGGETIGPDAEICKDLIAEFNLKTKDNLDSDSSYISTSSIDNVAEKRFETFNTQTSKLWNTFAAVFSDLIENGTGKEIESLYSKLRTGNDGEKSNGIYSYENIRDFYTNFTKSIGQKYYNRDMVTKYLRLYETNPSNADNYINNNLLGNRDMSFKKWIKQRILYEDGIYKYSLDNEYSENIELRSNNNSLNSSEFGIGQANIAISVYDPCYIRFIVGTTEFKMQGYVSPNSTYIDPYTNEECEGTLFSFPILGTNKEILIQGSGNIKEIKNIDKIQVTRYLVGSANKLLNIDLENSNLLENLTTGRNYYLQYVNLNNCSQLGKANNNLNLSYSDNIKTVNISNTQLTSISLSKGSSLESLKATKSKLESLELEDLEYFENLDIVNCESIKTIKIKNCPKLTDISLVESVVAEVIIENCNNLKTLDLTRCNKIEKLTILNCPKLETLNLSYISAPLLDSLNLASVYSLKNLNIQNASGSNNGPIHIRFPIDNGRDGEWNSLKSFIANYSKLYSVTYGSDSISDGIVDLRGIKNVTNLVISNCKIMEEVKLNYTGNANSLLSGCRLLKKVSGIINLNPDNNDNTTLNSTFSDCYSLEDITELEINNLDKCISFNSTFKNAKLNGNGTMDMLTQVRDYIFKKCSYEKLSSVSAMFEGPWWNTNSLEDMKLLQSYPMTNAPEPFKIKIPDKFLYDKDDIFFKFISNFTRMFAYRCFHSNEKLGTIFNTIDMEYLSINKNLSSMFFGHRYLIEISSNFFNYLRYVINFNSTFATFGSSELKKVNLLDGTRSVFPKNSIVSDCSQMFANNPSLTFNTLKLDTMFKDLIYLKNASRVFYGCTSFKPTVTPNEKGDSYNLLPIFNGCINLEQCYQLFYNCKAMDLGLPYKTSIYTDDYTKPLNKLVNSESLFMNCEKLASKANSNNILYKEFFDNINNSCNISGYKYIATIGGSNTNFMGFFGSNNYITAFESGLFDKMVNITTLSYFFYNMTNLAQVYDGFSGNFVTAIPLDLFINNPKITTLKGLFQGCIKFAVNIPFENGESIFKHIKNKITDLSYVFTDCPINGIIPENLINNSTKLTTIQSIFQGCNELDCIIPPTFIRGCTNLVNVSYAFSGCTQLGSNNIETDYILPNNFFEDCREVLNNASYFMYNCTNYKGKFPDGEYLTIYTNYGITDEKPEGYFDYFTFCNGDLSLLANCFNLNSTSYMFANCSRITGKIPSHIFWSGSKITDNSNGDEIYEANINSLSESNKYNKLNNISAMFSGCKRLNENYGSYQDSDESYLFLPTMFKYCSKIKNINSLFDGLNNMPESYLSNLMFKECNQIETAISAFKNIDLAGNLDGSFLGNTLVTLNNVQEMFAGSGSTNLYLYATFLLNGRNTNNSIKNISGLFNGAVINENSTIPPKSKFPKLNSYINAMNFSNKANLNIPNDWN